jgi:hypothetical protein
MIVMRLQDKEVTLAFYRRTVALAIERLQQREGCEHRIAITALDFEIILQSGALNQRIREKLCGKNQ